jgi:hypothetical protein
MPDIEFKDLKQSIGTELFTDPESFLEDLTDDAANISGGINPALGGTTVAVTTTVYIPDKDPTMTTTVYNPHPGGNTGINYTGLYTTIYKPIHTPPRHINYRTFFTGYA